MQCHRAAKCLLLMSIVSCLPPSTFYICSDIPTKHLLFLFTICCCCFTLSIFFHNINVLYHYTFRKQLNRNFTWFTCIICFIFVVVVLFLILVKPVAVHILAKRAHVSADKTYDIECKSSGSKPAAVITWWRGTKQIKRPVRNVSKFVCMEYLKVVVTGVTSIH